MYGVSQNIVSVIAIWPHYKVEIRLDIMPPIAKREKRFRIHLIHPTVPTMSHILSHIVGAEFGL